MSFKFFGDVGAAAGGGAAVWLFKNKVFSNTTPSSGQYIQIWDPNDKTLIEPDSAHVLLYTPTGWMKGADLTTVEDHPPSCGAAFGYKKYLKGSIPQRVYGWRGTHFEAYPYDYTNRLKYAGFNTSASSGDGAMMLPNPCGNQFFTQTDFVAPDAENNAIGSWDKVFNGGNGHWFDRSTPTGANFATNDGPGSNGSIFGRGYNGGKFPAGTGGPGTDTARGPVAKKIADGVFDELGLVKYFTQGLAGTDTAKADNGAYEVVLPPGLFLFSQLPFQYDTSLLQISSGMSEPGPRSVRFDGVLSFNVILEFKG